MNEKVIKKQTIFLNKSYKKTNKDPFEKFEMYIFFKKWILNCSDFDKKYLAAIISPLAMSILIDLLKKKQSTLARFFFMAFHSDLNKKILSFIELENTITNNKQTNFKLKLFYGIFPDSTFRFLISFFEKNFYIQFLKYIKKYFHVATLLNYNFNIKNKTNIICAQILSRFNLSKEHKSKFKKNCNPNGFGNKNLKFCKILKIICKHSSSINSIFLSRNETTVLLGFENSNIKIIELDRFESSWKLIGHSGSIVCAKLSECSGFITSCTINGELNLWSNQYKKLLVKYENFNEAIWDVCISAKEKFICTACSNSLAVLWNFNRLLPFRFFTGHKSDINVNRWHPQNSIVATGSDDQTVRLWDIRVKKSVACYKKFNSQVYNLEFSPSGSEICVSGLVKHIDIWDIRVEKTQKRIKSEIFDESIKLIVYSPDGGSLVFGLNLEFFKLFYRRSSKLCNFTIPTFETGEKSHQLQLKFKKIHQIKFNSKKAITFVGV